MKNPLLDQLRETLKNQLPGLRIREIKKGDDDVFLLIYLGDEIQIKHLDGDVEM